MESESFSQRVVCIPPNEWFHRLTSHTSELDWNSSIKSVIDYKYDRLVFQQFSCNMFVTWHTDEEDCGKITTLYSMFINYTEKKQTVYLTLHK